MRYKGETAGFARRNIGRGEPSGAPEPPRASDSEEWAWMVDEDPAFYLAKPGGVEAAGA